MRRLITSMGYTTASAEAPDRAPNSSMCSASSCSPPDVSPGSLPFRTLTGRSWLSYCQSTCSCLRPHVQHIGNKWHHGAHAADRSDDCKQLITRRRSRRRTRRKRRKIRRGKRRRYICYSCAFQSELGLCRSGGVFAEWCVVSMTLSRS